ncbi:histidine permease [Kluyveromyces marxianus]|uniref:Histidine permease n=1 Tax=Kluyveromyces marxianus (strain DMKU3-1042 / BCC 29191 / NBRC 104275) TaxID=1003335 RepID=W0TG91_KLUMD|nr:histidine permease [Kluyveromyces marxianus DMKU3-1042]BAO42365.1 histidine permease [Kluyveromyces marxianus DMKU3-1042]BAP73759.1 histidine permease [Kluyveromyces marxianus]
MIDKSQDKIPLQDISMQSFSKEESWSVEDKETSPKSAVPQKRYEDMNDVEKAIFNTKDSKLNKDLSIRHLLTLAVGGAIGTGLFVNSGSSLSTGGPASLVIAWTIISTCLFTIVNALGELSATFPVVGGFNVYVTRFVEPSLGFAVNFNYLAQWAILLPLELCAASITIRYWNKNINPDAWVSIFYVAIALANMLDVKSFGETEFVLSMVKILAIIGFTILGIVLICGGGPNNHFIGGKYWHDPGAFVGETSSQQFKGLSAVFITAAFSYSGLELVGVSAAESRNPRVTLPKAAKRTFWLITFSYLIILTLVGCLVPSNDPLLLNGTSSVDAAASPLVIAIQNGGIKGVPSLMNAIILIAVLSVANSAVYACSRCIVSMAEIGNLPRTLAHVDKKGRPLYAIAVTLFIGLLSFVAASDKRDDVFTWLSALSGLSTLFCWLAINIAHLRFRHAMKLQNRSLEELPYVSMTGEWGSWYGCAVIGLVLIASFWTSMFPAGSHGADAKSFFESYLSLPIFIVCYVGHKIWKRNFTLVNKLSEIDVDSGRVDIDIETLKKEKEAEDLLMKSKPFYIKFWNFWC